MTTALELADSICRMDTFTEHQRSEILKAASELRRLAAMEQAKRGAALEKQHCWYKGAPPFPQDQEWFIAETIYGDRVVFRSIDEGSLRTGEYAFTTADAIYMKAEIVRRWMQFPDCDYIPPAQPNRQPLTDEQINDAYGNARVQHDHIPHDDVVRITRAIEAAHGIKETP
jgi:hypothetical protein